MKKIIDPSSSSPVQNSRAARVPGPSMGLRLNLRRASARFDLESIPIVMCLISWQGDWKQHRGVKQSEAKWKSGTQAHHVSDLNGTIASLAGQTPTLLKKKTKKKGCLRSYSIKRSMPKPLIRGVDG
ncbi:hypothetical protein H4582DRAFT_2054034 [Lactarius indigo]|nr:hypothetical protein H4582DRAFT_2054034 [Lactarius indigo]